MRSLTVRTPSGRVWPPPLGMSARLTGAGRYRPDFNVDEVRPDKARRPPRTARCFGHRFARSFVPLDLEPRGFEGFKRDGLIHQAEPLASFDAVAQRRPHALRPDRRFRPPPNTRAVRWSLCQSPQRHRTFQASPSSSSHPAGSPRIPRQSGSFSYGLAVRLRLLPTPPMAGARTPQTRRPRGRTGWPGQARP